MPPFLLVAALDDLLSGVDWGSGFVGAAAVLGMTLVLRAAGWSIGVYKGAGEFDANRVAELETKVTNLTAKVDGLERDYRRQRELKHSWRSFAASLLQERWTIQQFAAIHECAEIVELMQRLDHLRENHPLMSDAQAMIEGDPTP